MSETNAERTTTEQEPGERIAAFGCYGIYTPYESHDGEVGWTVQKFEPDDDVGDMGEIIGEFKDRADAELFANACRVRAALASPAPSGAGQAGTDAGREEER